MTARILLLVCAFTFICAGTGICGVFSDIANEVEVKNGVKEITYDQFMSIRNSGEKYKLLDVLSYESYSKGHIEGALSFPLDIINDVTARERLPVDDNIIVYCGSFQCTASTSAARQLSAMGYNVLDYKGGLKEWQEKGNKLIPLN